MGRRKSGTVSRNKLIGILFILLMFFGLIFCFDPPNASALGDAILQKIGLKAWSNIDTGLHYTFIVAFVMYGIGLLGTTHYLMEFYPRFTKKLPLLSILFLVLLPSIYTFSSRTAMTLSGGIDAVEYDRDKSSCRVLIDTDGSFIYETELPLKNYSKKDVTFFIKLLPNQFDFDNLVKEDMITAADPDTGKPQAFTLHPKESANLKVTFLATPAEGITNFNGTFQPVSIIIYTDNEERKFINEY